MPSAKKGDNTRTAVSPPSPAWGLSERHDPSPAAAAAHAASLPTHAAAAIETPASSRILIGTASWTDPTMTAAGVFYPENVRTPEQRLRYYASRFPLVEVDSTYYALPARRMAELWVQRTPENFTFDVKAHALMTGQPTETSRLPRELREVLPEQLRSASRVYAKDLPSEIVDVVWEVFLDALEPLRAAGKLGSILLQYPRWFIPSSANKQAIVEAKERLRGRRGAVELRNARWFGPSPQDAKRTLAFLAEHQVPFVMVDGVQGLDSSVPPLGAVTSPALALLRMHGRNAATWEAKGVPTVERYRYLYDEKELGDWVPRLTKAAEQAEEVHVLMNNCYANYGTTNALDLDAMLRRAYGEENG
jgi:uncharacterized protein YecE (DUF72 family)